MIGSARLLPRTPLIRSRRFGLTDPSWPRRRQGRADGSASQRRRAADRHFRTPPDLSVPARSDAAPINLTVNTLTLSPRFRMLWQTWQTAGTRIERLERVITRRSLQEEHAERLIERLEWAVIPKFLPRTSIESERTQTLIERIARNLASRLPVQENPPTVHPYPASHPVPAPAMGVRPGSRPLSLLRRSIPSETRERHVTGTSVLTLGNRAQRTFERLEGRIFRALQTKIARHRFTCIEAGTPWRSATDAQAMAAADTRTFVAPLRPQAAPTAATQTLQTRSTQHPADRTFRVERTVIAPPPPTPAPTPQRAPQPIPQMDIAKLDTVLWQRFEKRLRIEQERRGRA